MQQPLIILCPMRSFSSVVCAMIGQHPELYGLPEVNLFIADTVAELLQIHRPRPHGSHGLLRALAQLQEQAQTDATVAKAQAWLEQHRDWTTKQLFDHLLKLVDPWIAVDKSPRTVLKREYLERAYAMYPNAYYLHLTRHPRSTAKSLLANLRRNAEWGGTFDAERIDPERIWLRAYQNIIEFTDGLPLGQAMRLKGEDLLSEPEVYLPQIAEWLDVSTSAEAIEAMLHPERSSYACYGPEQAKYGNDPEFLEKPGLRRGRVREPSLAGPLDWAAEREFSQQTLKLAKQIGYA